MNTSTSKKVERAKKIMDIDKKGIRIPDGPQYITYYDGSYIVWSEHGIDSEEPDIEKSVKSEKEIEEKLEYWIENQQVHEIEIPSMSRLNNDNRAILDCKIISEI